MHIDASPPWFTMDGWKDGWKELHNGVLQAAALGGGWQLTEER